MEEDLRKNIKELRRVSKIDIFSRPLKEVLEMVAETDSEKKTLIESTFLYLHNIHVDDPSYDGVFEELEPTFENFVAVYYTIPEFEFLLAWTFALATFNYSEALKNLKSKDRCYYIG